MRYHGDGQGLRLEEVPIPVPARGQVRVRVRACGVCRTDLHVVDDELLEPRLPIVPGHEVVGVVDALGDDVAQFEIGQRVGIPWLGWTCGQCRQCLRGRENLCPDARFTGYQIDGGYADYCLADARYCFALPEAYSDVAAAPLLCAGLIGYRALRMTRLTEEPSDESLHEAGPTRLGLYGFGAAAHIVAQVAASQGQEIYAFTSPGDTTAQAFARSLGAVWAGSSEDEPPAPLDAAILFAPVGPLVPRALRAVEAGGIVVCAGIHMSDIPSFPYQILWSERVLRSVANLTRDDATGFLGLAPGVPVRTETVSFPLEEANEALRRLRAGELSGAAVLEISR